jgi:alkanesulfonate monooxygenase SsuD/methylene tetrahydromethanopterin reductase-like flavin-dependent oxidoreductase (luciferase family)
MFAGDQTPFQGTHYQLQRPLNSPPPVQRPRPPIMIGGSGERKTLRLVARYGDACNLFEFAPAETTRKLEVLQGTARMWAGSTRRSRRPRLEHWP